jgi:hypothetical protein
MGIAGEFDHPRIATAYQTVAKAIHEASIKSGTVKSVGVGGLNGRPDLIQKFVCDDEYGVTRYAMSATDSVLVMKSMKEKAEVLEKIERTI